jgi:hypothetical protein
MAIISIALDGAGQYIDSESVCAHERVTTGLCSYSVTHIDPLVYMRGEGEDGNFSAGVENWRCFLH